MNNTKLIRLLSSFSKSEYSQFIEFVESPFHNKNERLISLAVYLKKYAPQFDDQNLSFEQAHQHLFENRAYQKDTLTKLFSKLFILAESFIVNLQLKQNPFLCNMEILKFHNQKSNTAFFEAQHRKIRKTQNKVSQREDTWAFKQMEIEHELAFYLSANADDGTGDINLQSTNDALDNFYIVRKLKYLCYMRNRQRLVSFPFVYSMENEVLGYLARNKTLNTPPVIVWKSALLLVSGPNNIENYKALKNNIEQFGPFIPPSGKRVLFSYLENTAKYVCDDYFEELFTLYEKQINEEILYKQNFLVPIAIKNIVTVAIRLKKLDWANKFLKDHQDYIFPDHIDKEDVFYLCRSMLCFAKEDFEGALEMIGKAKVKNLYFKLEERRLRLKIYYELNYFAVFEDSINSFRKFLTDNRKHVAGYYLDANRNFVNAVMTLYKTTIQHKDRSAKLEAIINEDSFLPEKNWLTLKLANIKGT